METKSKTITDTLRKLIYAIFLFLWVAIMCILLFVDKRITYYCQNNTLLPNLILLLIGIALTALFIFLCGKLSKNEERKLSNKKWLLLFSIVLLFIEVFIGLNTFFITGWDADTLRKASDILAFQLGDNVYMEYFQRYPNNVFLLFVITELKKMAISIGMDELFFVLICGILLVNAAVLVTGLVLEELFGNRRVTFIGYFVAVFLCGSSPWINIAYSDTFSILFPILTLYAYIKLRDAECPVPVKIIVVLGISCVGSLVKPQVLIVLVAILIAEPVYRGGEKKKTGREMLKELGWITASVAIVLALIFGMKTLAYRRTGIVPDESRETPYTHLIMMGMNTATDGVYSEEDVNYTYSFAGKALKKEKNFEIIKDRAAQLGAGGLAEHLVRKTLVNLNDGTFAWGCEGNFYNQILPEMMGDISYNLRELYYNDGGYYPYFATIEQLLWISVLFFCGLAAMGKAVTGEKNEMVIVLAVMGIVLFNTIFEARARYIFAYAPIVIVCGMIGALKAKHILMSFWNNHFGKNSME